MDLSDDENDIGMFLTASRTDLVKVRHHFPGVVVVFSTVFVGIEDLPARGEYTSR
jgi:uncharacterized protein with von Willebrand factor type A (vWA) domain